MKICYFGIYNPGFSRNRVYIHGLKQLGVEIVECRDDSRGFLNKCLKLWKKHRSIQKAGGYDAMIVGYPGHLFVPLAKILSKKPVVADLLGSLYDAEKHSHMTGSIKLLKAKLIDWLAVRFADIILLESDAQVRYYEGRFGKSNKYHKVYTGADESIFFKEERGMMDDPSCKNTRIDGGDSFTVLFRGKLTPECGIEHILNAAKSLENNNNIHFKIVGRGYFLEKTMNMIKENDLKNVELVSRYLSDDEMRRTILEASLLLGQFEDNHRLKRTIPHKAFEAFALGIPYLTCDEPAVREIVIDNITGFLVPRADGGEIAKKIRIVSKNPELLEKVSEKSKRVFEERLSSKKLAEEIVRVVSRRTQH